MFLQKFSPTTGKMEWVIEDDHYDMRDETAKSAFADMLHDDERNKKYYAATQKAIKHMKKAGQQIHMLDIGTGSGLLAMMAVTCGADRATACEAFPPIAKVAAEIVQKNGFSENINVISKRSTDVTVGPDNCDMKSQANLLVTELWDTELIGEGALPTLRDACQRLLEPGFVCVPAAGTIYTQVFTSKALWDMHQLDPNMLEASSQIVLPSAMTDCLGTASCFDLHIDELHKDEINLLSKPTPVLRFDFCKNSLNSKVPNIFSIPDTKAEIQESVNKVAQYHAGTIATRSGAAHGVVMWWSLDMDIEGKISLETAPKWAHPDGDKCQWRDHWMQAVYFLKKPLQVKQGQCLNIYCCHDDYSLWFDVQHSQSQQYKVERPICTCGAHVSWSRHRYCMLNDPERNSILQEALKEFVRLGYSSGFCISDASLLPLMAAKSGFKQVILSLPHSSSFKKIYSKFLHINELNSKIQILNKSLETVTKEDLPDGKVDVIIGEPFFSTSLFPWHNLHFWYAATTLKKLMNQDVKVMPQGGSLRGIAVEFKDLWKYHSPANRVEGFDLSLFDQLIQSSKLTNEELEGNADTCIALEPHHVWEYPCTAMSDSFTLMEFDFSKPIPEENMVNEGSIAITRHGTLHSVVLWMDFHVTDELTLTTGLTKNFKCNDQLDWIRHTKQGVYFMKSPIKSNEISITNLKYSTTLETSQGDIKFNFQAEQ